MSSAPHPPRPTGSGRAPARGSRWGTLVPVGIVVLGLAELALLIVIGVNTSLWWAVLIVVVGWIVGVGLLVAAGQQSFVRLRSLIRAVRGAGDVQDHLSRPVFTLLAALFFFFPGVLTDLVALVLLVTPVQRRTVSAMGLGSGSAAARTALRGGGRRGGVIDGEIIVEPHRPSSADGDRRPEGGTTPPTITQG